MLWYSKLILIEVLFAILINHSAKKHPKKLKAHKFSTLLARIILGDEENGKMNEPRNALGFRGWLTLGIKMWPSIAITL